MAKTLNFGLYRPSRNDSEQVDITLSDNFEIIDTELKNRKDELDGHKIAAVAHNSNSILHGEGTVESAFGEMNTRIIEVETNINQTAIEAKDIAKETQNQFDRVVAEAGSNNPEVVQARGDEVNLNARLNKENAYYHGITTEKFYDTFTKTTYYLTTIPHKDENGNVIQLKRGFANDRANAGTAETARSFANRHNASLTINASLFDTTTLKVKGTQIINGVVINEATLGGRHILAFKEDNTLKYYPGNTPASTILSDGFNNALTSFIPLIIDGVQAPDEIINSYESPDLPYRRQVIAQYQNKDIVVLSTESDVLGNVGFTVYDCIRILSAKGVQFAFMLDGGGSMQTVVRGTTINTAKDDGGLTERSVPDFLYFAKRLPTNRDKDFAEINKDIGELAKKVADHILDTFNKTDMNKGFIRLMGTLGFASQGIESWDGNNKNTKLYITKDYLSFYNYNSDNTPFKVLMDGTIQTSKGTIGEVYQRSTAVTDLNAISRNGDYWATPSATGNPDGLSSWAVHHYEYGSDGKAGIQVAYKFATPSAIKTRRKNNGTWEAWG